MKDKITVSISWRLSKGWVDRHVWAYRLTGGLIGHRVGPLPILLLTTTGRKSGQQRTSPLGFLTAGGKYIITASNSGREKHPAWYLNLQANPEATVQVKRKVKKVHAREASPEEREKLWPVLVRKAGNYAEYEKLTGRRIPMMILEPS